MMAAHGRRRAPRGRLLLFFVIVVGTLSLGATVTALAPSEVAAQVSATASAGVLLETAIAFEREGEWEVAEAIYEYIVENFGGTPAATEARRLLNTSSVDRPARISRVELQVFGSIYGLWLGVAIPSAFGADGSEAYGAGLLIGGPLGLFGSRAAIRARQFSEGQARAISWGGIWGTWQGFGWTEIFDFGVGELCDSFDCYPSESNNEEVWAGAVIGGLAGIATGAIVARNPVSSGVASAAQGGSTWGSIYGGLAAATFHEAPGDGGLATSLIVGNVGLLAGAALAAKYDVSRNRVRVITLGALVGLVGGGGIDLLVQPDDEQVAFGIPLLASMVGMGIAIHATRDDRATGGEPEDSASLLAYRDGTLRLGAPIPVPTLLPFEDQNGRPSWRPGLSMELFRARF